jgi:hypothetical protein
MTEQATEIVDRILKELCRRNGFCNWWDIIDEDIQAEILSDLHDIVFSVIEEG